MLTPPIPRKLLARARWPRAAAPHGPERDRGSVAVFTAVFAIAVVFLTALIMDGGIAMNARERATDIAGQAARAAAGDIDVGALQTTGQAQIGPGACAIANQLVLRYAQLDSGGVDKVDTATMVGCDAPAAGTGHDQVQITTKPLVGVLGGFTETGQTAVTECGIAQERSADGATHTRHSPPGPVRRRSAGDVLIGLLAVLALTALTVGVPFALVTIFGLPIPHSMPSMSVLTHQLDVFAVIKVLMVLVWLAWIQLVFCVIVEIRAAVRNAGMPARVPLAGGTQMMVHRLVTAALLLVTATTVLSPAFAHHTAAPPPRPAAVSASAVPAYIAPGQHAAPAAHDESHRAPIEKIYVVKPPVGRYHESLWEIAQNHLGDGRRYREIFQMNKDRVQPDGSMLTISSLIRPGWVLHMPADAHGPGIEVIAEGHHHAGDHGPDVRTVSRDHGHRRRAAATPNRGAVARPAAAAGGRWPARRASPPRPWPRPRSTA